MKDEELWQLLQNVSDHRDYKQEKIDTEKKIVQSLLDFHIKHEVFDMKKYSSHTITFHLKKTYHGYPSNVGIIWFYEYRDIAQKELLWMRPEDLILPHVIYIHKMQVDSMYRKHGIATALYKAFSQVYSAQFQGVPIARIFRNPLAEYTYRNLIHKKQIAADAYSEEFVERLYFEDERSLLLELKEVSPTLFPNSIDTYIRKDFPINHKKISC
jgi:GNAT superfamily N-acetyltransferase